MKDAYGRIARYYSWLSNLVFGNVLKEANRAFLESIVEKSIMIIGGGDGKSYVGLEENLLGEFWEKSPAMLKLAKKHLSGSKLKFQLGEFQSKRKADFIFLPFVLDTLSDEQLEKLLLQLRENLNPSGKVVFSDFFPPTAFLQKTILRLMILFFRLVTSHSRMDLPDYESFFQKTGYRKVDEKSWENRWIRTQMWVLA
ncbi:hypothetical protein D0X99_07670 [Algoriphagus lacus]|uniref:Class I SAM-dependent methyltransferase n=2 Tax=Algoriphagus lacus TaxID=2056311 RepID=A0A418PT37_9BACT|nr:hypothetical protein D0X99_07670 [Algoriphagus lacus]